ncbi:MAG TPA: cyclic nucleotide-binding domain-containing protein [Pilimelia sp.]|nr:cyclic nucleotide-binding domain-containing protein [Pilimelia sp.]
MTTGDNYLLADHPFLADLPQHWLQRLSVQAHPVVYQGGRRLFSERRPAERFWLLRSGRVALDLHVAGRGYVVIEWLDAGTVLGWSWLFPPFRWQFGAIAAEQTHAIEFSAAGVRRLVAEDAELGRELTTRCMSVVVDRLQASRTRLLDLYEYPAVTGP